MIQKLKSNWRGILARLPLPMLAIPASYGVFEFSLLFFPTWVAIIQAAAFESVYVGLAAYDKLSNKDKRNALLISGFAVVASVVYNTLSGMFRLDPLLLESWRQTFVGVAFLGALHGVPLALLAFLVSNFTLHNSPATTNHNQDAESQKSEPQMLEVVENQAENLLEIVIEKRQDGDQESVELVPQHEIQMMSQVGFDPRLLPAPKGLPILLRDAVLLYAQHKSLEKASNFSDVSRETLRKRIAEARKVAPDWVATITKEN